MGVKTKVFGPLAWRLLEALAVIHDRVVAACDEKGGLDCEREKVVVRNLFASIIFLLGFALPCIYCRISFQCFTNAGNAADCKDTIMRRNAEDFGIDVHAVLGAQSACKLVYQLHERVNDKLFRQDVAKAKTAAECVNAKAVWEGKVGVPFKTIRKTRFQEPTQETWESGLLFLALCMREYPRPAEQKSARPAEKTPGVSRAIYVQMFFEQVSEFLARYLKDDPFGTSLRKAWGKVSRRMSPTLEREEADDLMWFMAHSIFPSREDIARRPRSKHLLSKEAFKRFLDDATVECGPARA